MNQDSLTSMMMRRMVPLVYVVLYREHNLREAPTSGTNRGRDGSKLTAFTH